MRITLYYLLAALLLAGCGTNAPARATLAPPGASTLTPTATPVVSAPTATASPLPTRPASPTPSPTQVPALSPTPSLSPRPSPTLNVAKPPNGVTTVASLSSGGEARTYRIHVPKGYRAGTATPLVINLHGLGSNGAQQEQLSGMSPKSDREGFIVIYPEGRKNAWAVGLGAENATDRQFILDMVRTVSRQLTVDARRIYVTGISNGGGLTNRLACDLADTFAAVAPVAGAYNFWDQCAPARAMPVMAFHGTSDLFVPYAGMWLGALFPPVHDWAQAWAQRDRCSEEPAVAKPHADVTVETWSGCGGGTAVVLYTIENHGHSWPGSRYLSAVTSQAVNATDVMWEFFKKYRLP